MKPTHLLIQLCVATSLIATAALTSAARAQEQPPPEQTQTPPEQPFTPAGAESVAALAGTAFTYQGRLRSSGAPHTGNCDFQFSLWDAASGGTQIGSTVTASPVFVQAGLFTTPIDFGDGAFNGEERFLQIAVRCPAGSGSYTTLTPRQQLTPAPYALALPGMRTLQNATSANVIGGYFGNVVSPTVVGGTIGGGGSSGFINRVTANYATVGGGYSNTASGFEATVSGGADNAASSNRATVGGGAVNTASDWYATVGGGSSNTASGYAATVGGGAVITASGNFATVSGGSSNTASGPGATVGGGEGNTASNWYATVPGGNHAIASHYGQLAYASGSFANFGDAQVSFFVLRGQNTGSTPANITLYLNGFSDSISIPNNRVMGLEIQVVGTVVGFVTSRLYHCVATGSSISCNTPDTQTIGAVSGTPNVSASGGILNIQIISAHPDSRWVALVRAVEIGF